MSEVEIEVEDGVGVVTLAAAERRNALTTGMARELFEACAALDADPAIGAVVIRGSGGSFCAGAHRDLLEQVSADPAGAAAYQSMGHIYGSFARVAELEAPSIAAVRGAAIGAGVNLMLSCSLRIVATDARIAAGFRPLGLHPGGGHLALLARSLSFDATVAVGLFGEPLTGEDARRLGLAWDAVPDSDVEKRAMGLARAAGKDPELSRMVMRSVRLELGPPGLSLAAALDLERAAQMRTQRRRAEARG